MSSRVLKKLQGESDLNIHKEEEDEDASDLDNDLSGHGGSGSRGTPKKQLNINRYDLFNEQSMSESEVKEDDNETEHASTAAPHPVEQAKKKKKKRKKKAAKQPVGQRRSSEDKSDMDEIIRTLREVDKMFGGPGKVAAASGVPAPNVPNPVIKQLLAVQHKNLSASYELKRMFGSKVVQADQNKRRNNRGPRTLKSTWLIAPKENWPPVTKTGLYMSVEPTPDAPDTAAACSSSQSQTPRNLSRSLIWFRFEHNATYRQMQEKFLTAVESLDSDNLLHVINQQPFHVDSLIQLSELCKMSEDHAMASELIERAILSLESAFHSMFSLTAGNCRLDYRRQENRSLFVTLFKHAQYLEGRACARTALEIAKLIMSFDPENDPLAIILCIDYYALRAQQYEWLIQLYDEWDETNNLSQLPNMAYSYALALFYQHGAANAQLADAALQYALLMFPGVLRPLLQELQVQTDSRASTHSYFGTASSLAAQRPALQQLMALYTCRTKIVWQDGALLGWMERNVNAVLDRVDARDPLVAEYEKKRVARYKTPPRAILRHIILSDFKEKVPLEPFINKDSDPILMYDPLPPLDSINSYQRRGTVRAAGRTLTDASPLSMFFQSLLPTFNVAGHVPAGPVLAGAAGGAEAAAAAAAPRPLPNAAQVAAAVPLVAAVRDGIDGAVAVADAGGEGPVAAADGDMESFVELRQSLNSIVDAMRDFLTNIRVPERPNDADVDENESSDGEDGPNDYLT